MATTSLAYPKVARAAVAGERHADLYFFARPIVPVAAGRLCAEAHPEDRVIVDTAR